MSFLSDFEKNKNYGRYLEFYDFLIKENEKFNLTAITERRDFIIKGVQDCVYLNEIYPQNAKIVEIGSGAGFPSVPLKIEREDLDFTLIEANEKKCGFLNQVKEMLGFEKFEVLCGRAEELALKEGLRESFDFGIARAVAPLNILSELLLPFIKVGGKMVAYKGSDYGEEIKIAENALKVLGGRVSEVKEYTLDEGLGSRALIIIEKINATDSNYPRRFAKIKKCPL